MRTSERHDLAHANTDETQAIGARHVFAYLTARELAGPSTRLLDVGCGTGYGASLLHDTVAEYRGCDVSEAAVAAARSGYAYPNVHFDLARGELLPYDDGVFDVVTSFQVIEHVEHVPAYVREIQRVLRPAGTALITTPNRVRRLGPGERPWNRYHRREFDAQGLRQELSGVFSETRVEGVRGSERMEALEDARVARARRIASLDRLGLRYLLPERLDALVRWGLHSRARSVAEPFSPSEMWKSDVDLDASIDLLAIALK